MSHEHLRRIDAISTRKSSLYGHEPPGYTHVPEINQGDIHFFTQEEAIRFLHASVEQAQQLDNGSEKELSAFLGKHLQALVSLGENKPHLALVGHEYHNFNGELPPALSQLIRSAQAVGVEYIPEEIFGNISRFPTPYIAKKLGADKTVNRFRDTIQGTRQQAEATDAKNGKKKYTEGIYPYVRYGWFQEIINEANRTGTPYFTADIANSPQYMVHRLLTGVLSGGFLGDMEVHGPGKQGDSLYSRATGREFGLREMDMEQLRRMIYAFSFDKIGDYFASKEAMPEKKMHPWMLVTWPELHIAGMIEYFKQLKGVNPDLPYPLEPFIQLNTALHKGLDFSLRIYNESGRINEIDLTESLPSLFNRQSMRNLGLAAIAAIHSEWKDSVR